MPCHVTMRVLASSSDGLVLWHCAYKIITQISGIVTSFPRDHLGKYLKTGGDVAWQDTRTQRALSQGGH